MVNTIEEIIEESGGSTEKISAITIGIAFPCINYSHFYMCAGKNTYEVYKKFEELKKSNLLDKKRYICYRIPMEFYKQYLESIIPNKEIKKISSDKVNITSIFQEYLRVLKKRKRNTDR